MEGMSAEEATNKVRGHKAALSNPHVSSNAKSRSKQAIDDLGNAHYGQDIAQQGKEEGHVLGGYKAAVKNPNVSDQGKQHAKQKLRERGK
ncbi:uncharacterized protein BP5553_08476 [Venustampulla echinocandica]|uniref:Conidiation-specific protein 6 n=1 Tax=Venustampulla echinocandica TaxID=2656787 RepID=A0A370TEB7_9HELO|nr:uncharacterized protein BP5553_08476 [Venustampulla echinocandica]RDL33037.1 hypothetical protein BP5553_08476 [Venustampulla echinocandica]